MVEELMYFKLKTLEDMVKLVAFSPAPMLQHTVVEGRQVYFIQSFSIVGKPLVYYLERDEKLESKYVVYNRFNDTISFSDKPGSDGQSVYIPIIEIEKTNLLDIIGRR
ncbi:hypothetical protein [Candidatus Hecatella orcuttiae]|uniref:hypothetical protein n=1 Tax=Candidatus Hecatella orcuttiae TaxID=1935119 RepID=UPI0028681B21|nr:hypothetical protein [Candidatus Hecatella orcuttiae]